MPALPQNDIKIVIRIRGGINIAKVGQLTVTKAICMAACIEPNERSEDTICPNLKQNIMVVSTPSDANAAKYLRIRNISIEQTCSLDRRARALEIEEPRLPVVTVRRALQEPEPEIHVKDTIRLQPTSWR
ncbi:hypothetical protein HPB49_023649 [Dermacentor silvarum]|uniref:Uncharacterized protein n=1 Tax=Dermacentor silvarum TaxID=543639 RepID=A0ACB8E437_DERSI|nr:hypothetical protein HPB49_023649 [Dermacentor silvarum]